MNDIYRIYHNDIGIAFQWKKDVEAGFTETIQVVFRNTGFYLDYKEVKEFYNKAKVAHHLQQCEGCAKKGKCSSYLLQTPTDKVDLAVTKKELNSITDLLKGTLFQIELNGYINEICKN
ncbi:hypothetical protein [Pseudofulvibacter geojedonensis]|uniref:Uncharacterized protein n=1 Tax=Pseudofulvibacter geojedonensis TaxID=1123758 RepID=A0ABW3I0E3_9FLAO